MNIFKKAWNKFDQACSKIDAKLGGDADKFFEEKFNCGCDILYDKTGEVIAYGKAKTNQWRAK